MHSDHNHTLTSQTDLGIGGGGGGGGEGGEGGCSKNKNKKKETNPNSVLMAANKFLVSLVTLHSFLIHGHIRPDVTFLLFKSVFLPSVANLFSSLPPSLNIS